MEPPHADEPQELRQLLNDLIKTSGRRKFIVFTGNKLPHHLWTAWRHELKKHGYTWQDLLRALSHTANDILDWAEGRKTWDQLLQTIWKTLTSQPPSKQKHQKTRKIKTLEEYF